MKLIQLLWGENALAGGDRRQTPRTFTDRQVILAWKNCGDRIGCATVMEWSSLGLRIRHTLPLKRGDRIIVITPDDSLEVRVIWLGDIDGAKEAGLLLARSIDGVSGF